MFPLITPVIDVIGVNIPSTAVSNTEKPREFDHRLSPVRFPVVAVILTFPFDAVICISDRDVRLALTAVMWYVPFNKQGVITPSCNVILVIFIYAGWDPEFEAEY